MCHDHQYLISSKIDGGKPSKSVTRVMHAKKVWILQSLPRIILRMYHSILVMKAQNSNAFHTSYQTTCEKMHSLTGNARDYLFIHISAPIKWQIMTYFGDTALDNSSFTYWMSHFVSLVCGTISSSKGYFIMESVCEHFFMIQFIRVGWDYQLTYRGRITHTYASQ